MITGGRTKRLMYLVTEDWYFCSHRLTLARAARLAGYDVGVVTQVARHRGDIERADLRLFPIRFSRSWRRPLQDGRTIMEILRIYRREKPDIVHHVSLKPIIYGTIAARLAGVPHVVNAFTGVGFLFTSKRLNARVVRGLLGVLWRVFAKGVQMTSIVQNRDDQSLLESCRMTDPANTLLIPGSGVDTDRFSYLGEIGEGVMVVLASRLLWDKGIAEFVECARLCRERGCDARFVVVGEPDPENPMSIDGKTLKRWSEQGYVECWGRRDDMEIVLHQAHIVCLPSYREGLPKILLEAGASGRPVVTTDSPGCRDVVRDGETGLVVPPQDSRALADAICKLVSEGELRRRMGVNARKLVVEQFSDEVIHRMILDVYGAKGDQSGRKQE